MKNPVSTWREAIESPESGELTYRSHGKWDRTNLEHGWWVSPYDWAIGLTVSNDWTYGGRFSFTVEVGPLTWHLTLVKGVAR